MKKGILTILLCGGLFNLSGKAPLESHFKNIERKSQPPQIQHIDFIYLINLDQRPEKLEYIAKQFDSYGLKFFRFPAIYGWDLSREDFEDLGVYFLPGMRSMEQDRRIAYNGQILVNPLSTAKPEVPGEFWRLGPQFYYKNCFSVSMKAGAIGCTLSHLSILQDALDSGYETIWILEDDVRLCSDPRNLGKWIDLLDQTAGSETWDILYTDSVTYFKKHEDIEWIWRPDISIDYNRLIASTNLGDFLQIGGRGHTHSMVIRRSGMQKILEFYKTKGMFLPYDMELSIIPNLRLINLKPSVAIQGSSTSDTMEKHF